MLKILSFILALGMFAVLATSCGTDHAKLRFVQASPDAGSLDVDVDGKTVATALDFGSVSPASDYLTVAAGNRRVEVRPTGATDDLINSTIDFGSQKSYTLLAIELAPPVPPDTLPTVAALLKTDDNSAPASGNVKLRVIHSAPDGAGIGNVQVDVYVVAPGTDITNVAPDIANLSYQQASTYLSVMAATYEVIVTDSADPAKSRLIDHTYTFTAGQVRTFVTVDAAGGGAISGTPIVLSDLN